MPRIADFLNELAKPANVESVVRDLWHARDREDAMVEFGLSEDQMGILRRALDTENLDEVKDTVNDETQGEQAAGVFLWVK